MLRFQAECFAFLINLAAFAGQTTIKKIARVKLQARLGREHFEDAPGGGVIVIFELIAKQLITSVTVRSRFR